MVVEGKVYRKDRKKDIKPTLYVDLKEIIYRLAHITDTPVKSIAEQMCIHGISNKDILKNISPNFRRDVRIDNTLYRGNIKNTPVNRKTLAGECERISLRVTAPVYEVIVTLAYALDCSKARACAMILEECLYEATFVNKYVEKYLEDSVDPQKMRELRKFMQQINKHSIEKHSWAELLSYIVDEIKTPLVSTQEKVSDFVINHWRKN